MQYLTTFDGYLKQLDTSRQSKLQRKLFARLFPRFSDKRELDATGRQSAKDINRFKPLFEARTDLDQPRRFAGVSLPRNRYSTVCSDSKGSDRGTLVNELAAYRDASVTGKVDLFDLADNINPSLGPARQAIAVAVHQPWSIPEARPLLSSRSRSRASDSTLLVVEYSYTVLHARIDHVVDLRLPNSRQWFFSQFSQETPDGSIIWVAGGRLMSELPQSLQDEIAKGSFVITSRHSRRSGIAPRPTSFYSMLPTLMNPEEGGGTAADGGAILQAIGTWMITNRIGALIFPSARSDCFVDLHKGRLEAFGGWNLVDYRADSAPDASYSYIVESPWAWLGHPSGVRLEVASEKDRVGSFRVVGMESYWQTEYDRVLRLQPIWRKEAPRWRVWARRLLAYLRRLD